MLVHRQPGTWRRGTGWRDGGGAGDLGGHGGLATVGGDSDERLRGMAAEGDDRARVYGGSGGLGRWGGVGDGGSRQVMTAVDDTRSYIDVLKNGSILAMGSNSHGSWREGRAGRTSATAKICFPFKGAAIGVGGAGRPLHRVSALQRAVGCETAREGLGMGKGKGGARFVV